MYDVMVPVLRRLALSPSRTALILLPAPEARSTLPSFRLRLLPFDGGGRFGGDVVDDAGDAVDFVDDPGADASEGVVGETGPVRGHGVFGGDGADGADAAVGAVVTHDA